MVNVLLQLPIPPVTQRSSWNLTLALGEVIKERRTTPVLLLIMCPEFGSQHTQRLTPRRGLAPVIVIDALQATVNHLEQLIVVVRPLVGIICGCMDQR
jgi:hypothetical protein